MGNIEYAFFVLLHYNLYLYLIKFKITNEANKAWESYNYDFS